MSLNLIVKENKRKWCDHLPQIPNDKTANGSTKTYASREKSCETTDTTVGTRTDLTLNPWK